MKSIRMAMVVGLALLTTAAVAQSDTQKSFAQLKSLAGMWEGKASDGKPVQVSYRMTAGGSALMSEIMGEADMITMFHMDGDRLLLTHYCAAGNQPRMKATASPDGKSIAFDFLDVTNLASPDAGHMQHVVFTFLDANHHAEDWMFTQEGKEMHERFELQRKQ